MFRLFSTIATKEAVQTIERTYAPLRYFVNGAAYGTGLGLAPHESPQPNPSRFLLESKQFQKF